MRARSGTRDDRGDERLDRDEPYDEDEYDQDEDEEDEEGYEDDEYDDEEAGYDDEDEEAEPPRRTATARRRTEALSAPLAARAGMQHIADLTGKELAGVTSLERADDGWLVGVEVVEDRRIPSSTDMLGLYLAQVDADGSLVTYRRTKRYPRGRGDSSEGS